MESVKLSLCPACDACRSVEILGDEVRIGEFENTAILKKEEWNVLVELIRSGKLTQLRRTRQRPAASFTCDVTIMGDCVER